jgi:hypothetical protein
MKYIVHPRLGSLFDMAMALFREIAEQGPTFGEAMLYDSRLAQAVEVADMFGKLALHDAASPDEFRRMNKALTSAALKADAASGRGGHSFYRNGKRTFADAYPGFDEGSAVAALDAQPDLFDSRGYGGAGSEYHRMVEAAYAVMPYRDSEDFEKFSLGLCLLVAATTLSLRRHSADSKAQLPERI